MLERMDVFFNNRVDGYDAHMLDDSGPAKLFYPFTAEQLPRNENASLLDLGCGTGLELEYYFQVNPTAKVTCIDLAAKMLDVLRKKFPNKALTIIQGSYFEVTFEENFYDGAVSVESLHHFTREKKTSLYRKVFHSLKNGGAFVLTDYFAATDNEEDSFRQKLTRLKAEQGLTDSEFYHFDTPLTVLHEIECLSNSGFTKIEILGSWATTCTLRATK